MAKHSAKTEQLPMVGRHMADGYVPPTVVDPPRPRMRNDRYDALLAAAVAALWANAVGIALFLFFGIWTLIALGPEDFPGFIIVMALIWAWSKRRPKK